MTEIVDWKILELKGAKAFDQQHIFDGTCVRIFYWISVFAYNLEKINWILDFVPNSCTKILLYIFKFWIHVLNGIFFIFIFLLSIWQWAGSSSTQFLISKCPHGTKWLALYYTKSSRAWLMVHKVRSKDWIIWIKNN